MYVSAIVDQHQLSRPVCVVRARLAFMHYLYTNVIQNVIINRMYGAILLCLHAHYEVKQPPHHHSPLLSHSVKNYCEFILDLEFYS